MRWADFLKLRRRAQAYAEVWSADDRYVFRAGELLGTMISAEVARQVVDCHNNLIPLVNMVAVATLKRMDTETINEQERNDPS